MDDRISDSDLRMTAREAVLKLAATIEPDGAFDPADDRRPAGAIANLAEHLGSRAAAEGVQLALGELWGQWKLGKTEATVATSCSWCHTSNPTTQEWCSNCGHSAHVPRTQCRCRRCTPAL